MADVFVQVLLENLNSLIRKEVGLLWGVDKDMKKLSSLLSTIQAVLEDAEEKQVNDKALQNWLQKLKEAAYKVDDILDDCATEVSRLESKDQNSKSMKMVNISLLKKLRPDNILFCRKIGVRMREIRERLDEIAEEKIKFHLNEVVSQRGAELIEERQTGSIITQSHIYGRDEDKQIIVENLVNHVACCDDISVYPIVGIGGLGKTTLAQVVYNDERVSMHFELRIWVCISEDFNVKKIIKAIIESATGIACEDLDLDPLQRRLQDILNRKRYLLVLDDVWSEDQEKWDRLKDVLACGSKGASIIVTTRSRKVASIMGTLPMHHLSGLSEDECWLLFKERAFGQEKEERPNLVAIGKEIAKKCGGVPLAVKSLGSLMRYKSEENEWLRIEESDLWNLPQEKNSILPALRLSYSHLPSKIKRCFAFCTVFPKDFEIERQNLIHLWIANGFIEASQNFEPEDIGIEICNELYWRSFFQDARKDESGNNLLFRMHDLVHDLAQFIVKDEFFVMEAKGSNNISKSTLHVRVDLGLLKCIGSEALYGVETLRTLILIRPPSISPFEAYSSEFSCDFSRLISLRVLSTPTSGMWKLSSSIRHLKHLRYLDLSSTSIKLLPKSLCSLLNLQTLNLKNCFHLRKLPKRMRCLKNLRHLFLNRCDNLSQMPPKIGQITCLKTLTLFIVGKTRGCHLAELKGLNLGGELRVTHLNRVANLMDAEEANLVGKPNLRRLELSWGPDSELESMENVEKVFEALQPHPNLENLTIEGFKGAKFPLWMNYQILNNVVSITLSGCRSCRQLPPLWQLPRLRYLKIINLIHLEYIDPSFQGDKTIGNFPSLEELNIHNLSRLQRLSRHDGSELFPCLTKLEIMDCPELTLPCLPSAKTLVICSCDGEILKSISHFRSLTHLDVDRFHNLLYLPHGILQNLSSLREMYIRNARRLKGFAADLVSRSALQSLYISQCPELEAFPEQVLEGLNALQHLTLVMCIKFSNLSEGLRHLSALESLTLNGCPGLVSLPNGIKYLNCLRELTICGQPTASFGDRKTIEIFDLQFSNELRREGSIELRREGSIDPKLAVLPESIRYIPTLQTLSICRYPELASLPHWLGDLTALQSLRIYKCPKLPSLPASIQSLPNLQNLYISTCPELVKRCEKETGEDWHKIAHVPNVILKEH